MIQRGPMSVVTDERRWEIVLARDSARDGEFVYGVDSTGVYCRPSCPSRRPGRARVRFFDTPDAAEAAGYRACLRCEPQSNEPSVLRQVRTAREFIDQHPHETVTLARLGRVARMSPFHLQRTFKRIYGLSPKAYATAGRVERMKLRLRNGDTVTRATYEAGYGSSSRAYDQARAGLGMTPGSYRKGGRGMTIGYTVVTTPVGYLLAATTERGLCAVKLGDEAAELESALHREYPEADLGRKDGELSSSIERVVEGLLNGQDVALQLDVPGTTFQWQVWDALRRIPHGETRSYHAIAEELGRPTAARAVARACASNRLALVIPCHRAVRESGEVGGYRWGVERKRNILERERVHRDSRSEATVPAS